MFVTPTPTSTSTSPATFLLQGRYGLKRGLKHYTECQLCPEGLVCEIEGANNLEYEQHMCKDDDDLLVDCQASLCPNDAVCGMGTKKETMLNIKCPPGFYCTYGTAPNGTQVLGLWVDQDAGIVHTLRTVESWYDCPLRYYCPQGTTFATKLECAIGKYCPTGSAQYCCTPGCKLDLPTSWLSICDPISLQSATLEDDLDALAMRYPWSLALPRPKNLGKTCKTGTTSLRKAGSNDDCFVDWKNMDEKGPAFYLFPFLNDARFLNTRSYTTPMTRGNASWVPEPDCPKQATTERVYYYNVEDLPRVAVPAASVARFTFNFSAIPKRLAYDDFFRISIYVDGGASGRSSSRLVLPQRFYNMVNDEKARMATEGRASTEDLVEHYPMVTVVAEVEEGEEGKEGKEGEEGKEEEEGKEGEEGRSGTSSVKYTIRLQNANDRPLGGSFTLQAGGRNLQVPAQASATELEALLRVEIGNNNDPRNGGIRNVTVVRSPLQRMDDHAGYTWTVHAYNTTSMAFPWLTVTAETCTDGLLNQREYSFDLLVRKAVGVRVALEILHENIPDTYTQCRHYTTFLLGSKEYPVASLDIKRPSRFHYGEPVQTGLIISRIDSENMHLPANLPMNNSGCQCTNFSSSGCLNKGLRKECELPPYGVELDLVLPQWGRLDSDPLRPTLASHEKSIYWAYSEFSVEKVKLNAIIGQTMELLKKEVTVQLRGRYRSVLASPSPFSNSDKRLYFERHSNYLPMPFFPFFSNCKEFSSRISPFELFEHHDCNLVPPAQTLSVEAKYPSFSDPKEHSDNCDLKLTCIYDEISEDVSAPYTARIEDSREKYWFGLTQDDTTPPFYMTYDPMTSAQMMDLQPRPSESSIKYWYHRKELVPVTTFRNRRYYGLSQQYAPKNVTMVIKYWQESKRRKHIVSANLQFDAFWRPDFCGGTDDHQYYPDCACGIDEYNFNSTKAKLNVYKLGCSRFEKRGYHLRVLYEPMGYFDLFNAAAFPSYVYFAFFVGIAVVAVLFLVAVRVVNLCATCCRPSLLVMHKKKNIRLTLKSFILRSQMPVAAAFVLHTLPFFIVMAVVGGLVHSTTLNLFWNFPGRIQDTFGKCFPPFSPVGGASCREALRDDTEKMFWVLTRLRFTLGPVSLWYIRRGICLICPAECEHEFYRFTQWLTAPENKTRLQMAGKDMETKRIITKEIADKRREICVSPAKPNGSIASDDPIYKKRSHLWMFAFCHVVFLLMVIGWSRWKILQNDQTMLLVVVVLKVLKIPYELWLKNSLREYWLMTSFLITWSIMEFLVMLGSPTLMLFLIAFTGSILFDCLKRMFLDPCLLRRAQISMTGRRKKVHGREAYDHLMSSARMCHHCCLFLCSFFLLLVPCCSV